MLTADDEIYHTTCYTGKVRKKCDTEQTKTETMIISKKHVTLACNITEERTSLKESRQFDYLGPIKKSDCPRNEDINMREAF